MDIIWNSWGALLWLLIGGIGGWIINTIINGSKITTLKDSILDRDSRLLAISRDHKAIIGEQEKKNLVLKSDLTHLERAHTELQTHNNDLRNTIDELRKSQEDQLALLFEPQHSEIIEKSQWTNANADSPPLYEVLVSDEKNEELKKKSRKLKKIKKKLKTANKRAIELIKQIANLKKAIKKGPKPKTILTEIPVIIREEILIKESIDMEKLEKLFGFKVPIIKSRKTIQISKKKGKPIIVKK